MDLILNSIQGHLTVLWLKKEAVELEVKKSYVINWYKISV